MSEIGVQETPCPEPSESSGSADVRTAAARSRVAQRFEALGDAAGRDVVQQMEESTRHVIQKLVGSLQTEIRSLRGEAGGEHTAPHEPDGSPAAQARKHASGRRPDRQAIELTIRKIHRQFQEAVGEWHRLAKAVEAIESEMVEMTYDRVFGNLFVRENERVDLPDLPEAVAVPEATEAPEAVPAPDAPDEEAPTPTEDSATTHLEEKVDDLIVLVRNHLLNGPQADAGGGEGLAEWTQGVAREIADQLRSTFALPTDLCGGGRERPEETPQDTGSARPSRQISLDDVASMIDEITRRNA